MAKEDAPKERGLTPAELARQVEARVAADLEKIRDPEIRKEARRKLEAVLDRVRGASGAPAPIERGTAGFFGDWLAGRRAKGRQEQRGRGREGLHVDAFGFDRIYWRRVEPFFSYLYENYFRVEASGVEHLPLQGRGLLVANHSGILPWDALMLREAVEREHPAQRHVRPLVEDYAAGMPFLGPFLRRVGVARADQLNAERLLEDEKLVAVFPEGVQGVRKPYRRRYRLQRFGRGGTVKLAVRTGSPIIPTAIVGGEEVYPIVGESEWAGKALGLPTLPLTPMFPWLGLAGLIPLPSKWSIRFGAPVDVSRLAPDVLEDDIQVNRLNEDVRQRVQQLLFELLKERRSAWMG